MAWAVERFGSKLAMACSFQEAVLIDIAVEVDPAIEVIFLDTGSHFPETLEYVETIRSRYDLNLTVTHPVAGAEQWPCGTAQCCEFRKVRPLKQALAGKDAWITGLKRVDAPTRAGRPDRLVRRDTGAWSRSTRWPPGPTRTWPGTPPTTASPSTRCVSQGYLSIGCAPTTRPVAEGEDPRAGRWSDSDKVECGLHV